MTRNVFAVLALAFVAALSCSDPIQPPPEPEVLSVTISPTDTTVDIADGPVQFAVKVETRNGASKEVKCSADAGTINANYEYTPPIQTGTYKVTCTSVADPTKAATMTVTVVKTNAIAFSDYDFNSHTSAVFMVEPKDQSSNIRTLITKTTPNGSTPEIWELTWSPDGMTISFMMNSQVYLRSNGGSIRLLISGVRMSRSPAWSPDGKRIAFVFVSDDSAGIALTDTNGANFRTVFSIPCGSGCTIPDRPAWSPDGNRLAFGYVGGIHLLEVESRTITIIRNDTTVDGQPAWSPDGRKIVYASGPMTNSGWRPSIWVMDADGNNRVRLTTTFDTDPVWSPDGKQIAFTSFRVARNPANDPEGAIYVMNADGANEKQIYFEVGHYARFPAWRP